MSWNHLPGIALIALLLPAITANADFATAMKAYEAGNYETAIEELLPLAKQGNAAAQYQMGLIYNNGDGVPQNYRDALVWFRRAAERGHVDAQIELGRMFLHGKGVRQDNVMAYVWLNLAVAQGDDELGLGEKGRRLAELNLSSQQLQRAQRLSREYHRKYGQANQQQSALSIGQSDADRHYHLQLGSFQNEVQALAEWQRLQTRYPDILGQLQFNIERADLGQNRIYYRLQVGPLARTAAAAKCLMLSQQHQEDCLLIER